MGNLQQIRVSPTLLSQLQQSHQHELQTPKTANSPLILHNRHNLNRQPNVHRHILHGRLYKTILKTPLKILRIRTHSLTDKFRNKRNPQKRHPRDQQLQRIRQLPPILRVLQLCLHVLARRVTDEGICGEVYGAYWGHFMGEIY